MVKTGTMAYNAILMQATRPKYILPILFGTLLLDTIGFGIVIPIIPSLFTNAAAPGFMLGGFTPGMQLFMAGLITAVFGLVQFVAAPILGELSDVYGRKKLLTIGVGVLAVSQLLFGLGVEIGSLALLFFARTIAGLAAANIGIAQATIADVTEPKDRAKNFGLIGAAFGLGFIIGPLLAGWTTELTGNPAVAFWVASLLGIINLIFVSLFLTETNHSRSTKQSFTLMKGVKNIRIALRDVDARPLYLTSFLYLCGFTFFTSFVGVLLINQYEFTAANVGTFFAFVGVFMFITQVFILRVLSRMYRELSVLRVSILCAAGIVALYPFMSSGLFIYALIPLLAVPQGLTMATLPALISKGVSGSKQGAALGINASLMALAQGVVPLVAGGIASLFGLSVIFIMGSLSMVAAWFVLFGRKTKRP